MRNQHKQLFEQLGKSETGKILISYLRELKDDILKIDDTMNDDNAELEVRARRRAAQIIESRIIANIREPQKVAGDENYE